jgi:hypothetical protein
MAALQSEFAKLATKCGSWGTRADQGVRPTEQHSRNQNRADGGVGRGPGGPPYTSSQGAKIIRSSSTTYFPLAYREEW